jgi:MFS family permease
MATQLGYAAGLFFLIPLGDYIERQRLILRQAQVLFLALIGMMLSPTATVLVFFSFITGMSATVAQQIVPLAASLCSLFPGKNGGYRDERRSRRYSCRAGDWRSYRTVFRLARRLFVRGGYDTAGTVFILRILPSQSLPAPTFNYLALLRSLGHLWQSEPQVRNATLTQAMLFASFSVLWTVLPFWLAHRYDYGAGVTGTLATLGLIGILCAPVAGSFSDRQGHSGWSFLGVASCCWPGLFFGWNNMAGMVVGILLLDAGEQCVLIANQHTIYALRPDARNRLNTLFMCVMFIGGACGSLTATGLWEATHNWTLISLAGGAFVLSGMLLAVRRKD